MSREQLLAPLREHRQELERAGIVRLVIFGSVARGENMPQSEVDLMGDFDYAKRLNLFDMVGLELRLTEIAGSRVELSDRKMLKPPVKLVAERESVLAFQGFDPSPERYS
jgi:predicted nucleotidyltransferase